jgi:hypothetical protein
MVHKWSSSTSRLLVLVLVLGLLAACSPAASPSPSSPPAAVVTPQAPTPAAATQAPTAAPATPTLPSPTAVAATATAVPPSPTAVAATPTKAAPGATAAQMTVQVFLIAVGDNGQSGQLVGCGDSAIPVQVSIPPTQGVLRAALGALFSIKQQYYGESGLYNALCQSNLQVDSVTIQSGTAIINLSGTLTLGGECDNPRVEAQIEQTALQFSTVQQVSVFLNGKALKDVLSLKG